MIYRLHARGIGKKGDIFNEDSISSFESRVKKILDNKGICTLIIIGSPGTGKTSAAKEFIRRGFLSFEKEKTYVIDDLRGENGERYTKKSIRHFDHLQYGKLLILIDYRAAWYLKNADIGLFITLNEDKRLMNLKSRSPRSLRRYKKRFYRNPPIPYTYNYKDFYICKENLLTILNS